MKIEIKKTDITRQLSELLVGDVFYLFDNPQCPLIYLEYNDIGNQNYAFDLSSSKSVVLTEDMEVGMYRNFKFVGEV